MPFSTARPGLTWLFRCGCEKLGNCRCRWWFRILGQESRPRISAGSLTGSFARIRLVREKPAVSDWAFRFARASWTERTARFEYRAFSTRALSSRHTSDRLDDFPPGTRVRDFAFQ